MVVVFPAPLGPISPVMEPSFKVRLRLLTAFVGPHPFWRFSAATMVSKLFTCCHVYYRW